MSDTANRGADQELRASLADIYGTYQRRSDKDGDEPVDGFTRANDAVRGEPPVSVRPAAVSPPSSGPAVSSAPALSSVADRLAAVLRSNVPGPGPTGDA